MAAATKICRGAQATKHMRTSSQAAQAALAIAPPPSLVPLPQVLSLTGPQHCSISPARSRSLIFIYFRSWWVDWAMGVARKLLSRLKRSRLLASVYSIFSGFPSFLILRSALPNSLGVYFNWEQQSTTTLRAAAPGAPAEASTRGYVWWGPQTRGH